MGVQDVDRLWRHTQFRLDPDLATCVSWGEVLNLTACFLICEVAVIPTLPRMRLEIFKIITKKLAPCLLPGT